MIYLNQLSKIQTKSTTVTPVLPSSITADLSKPILPNALKIENIEKEGEENEVLMLPPCS